MNINERIIYLAIIFGLIVGYLINAQSSSAASRYVLNYVTTSQYGCGPGKKVNYEFFDTGYGALQRCTITISK